MKKLVGFFAIAFLLTVTIAGLLLSGVKIDKVQAQSTDFDFVCPTEDIANTGCMGPKDCLYPNPENCNAFIHCEINADNTTGRPTLKDCPAGLEWNDNEKICGQPVDSTCGGKNGGNNSGAFVCPIEDIAQTACQGPKDCLYPNPDNCNSFIQCEINADNTTGRPTVKDCPSGLEWNDNNKTCDWPVNSTCNGKNSRASIEE